MEIKDDFMTTMNEILKVISPDEISGQNLDPVDLWFLKNDSNGEPISGPYTTQNIKDYIQSLDGKVTETVACNFQNQEEWKPILLWEQFQRRKPQLMALSENVIHETFYLLENGNKIGPFEQEQIQTKLTNHEIIYSDFISIDKGVSWLKIFELSQFDRRIDSENCVLPFAPNEETFRQSQIKGLLAVENNQASKDLLLVFASSAKKKIEAFIGLGQSEESPSKRKFDRKKVGYGLGFALVCVGVFSLWKSPKQETLSQEEIELSEMQNHQDSRHQLPHLHQQRNIASEGMSPRAYKSQSLHQNSLEHKVPVPITDSNPVNYDDPPVLHDMADPIEKTVDAPLPQANEPEPASAPEVAEVAADTGAEIAPAQEEVREPASSEENPEQSIEPKASEPSYNQEVEG